jgi:cyclopropane-fatty-acyl-phospholipid synthase
LEEAEAAMLALTCERAQLSDGMDILELGCGWGSLSLWMAAHYPRARIVAVSNSNPQREFIQAECVRRGLTNLEVRTCDMNDFDPGAQFDRVVSLEMFEHMRNWRELFRRVASWLRPEGLFFLHVFVHRRFAYPFENEGESNWMGRHFFSGGIMPSEHLPGCFAEDFAVREQWYVNGTYYRDTCEAWLRNCDARKPMILPILATCYGDAEAHRSLQRWRMFFMACAELFGYARGEQWGVGHYLLAPRKA